MTFKMLDIPRAMRGMCASPTLLKIADSKLYIKMTGIPSRYILRYASARGMTSSGMLNDESIGSATSSPMMVTKIPARRAKTSEV